MKTNKNKNKNNNSSFIVYHNAVYRGGDWTTGLLCFKIRNDMKSIWKYICIGLIVLLVGTFSISMYTQNKLKDRIIECEANSKPDVEYVYLTDTIEVNKVQTKYKTVKEYVHDTTLLFEVDSTIVEIPVHDTFYLPVEHNVYTSTLDTAGFHMKADIHYSGIEPKLDSINYDVVIEHKKKPCCWLKRLFNKCE